MERPPAIAYVEIAELGSSGAPPEPVTGFAFHRFARESFRHAPTTPPHRHNFQELLIIQAGHARHALDGHAVDLTPGTVALITRGQVHAFEQARDLTGWLVRFTDEFLPAALVSPTWNYHATLFNRLGQHQTLALDATDLDALGSVLALIEAEWTAPTPFEQASVLRQLLAVLIVRLERISQQTVGTTWHTRDAYRRYQQFMTLLETDFARHHDVRYYATALGQAPARLARLLRQVIGKSTKHVIDERIVLEAKRYLCFTDLPVKDIAVLLGYTDVFHLSKTFKRVTGVAPQVFRAQREN